MNTYGFHGLHGRALPVAEGIKIRRPDLDVFVVTGDGDCTSIGAGHWIHAIRYNMNMTVLMLDNQIYGLTKKQVSPTSPRGLRSNTSPRGSYLEPLNPLSATLAISNVSYVAQAADWIPELLYEIISQAYHHKGFAFVRILQRCPEFVPDLFDPWVRDPEKTLMLNHTDGVQLSPAMSRVYQHQEAHDPSNIDRAREIASLTDRVPVGVLYRNRDVPCYEDLRKPDRLYTNDMIKGVLEGELDKFTIWPTN
jgi:2-oxoglutarate ferredoxin oxidoreductase subunit beta